MATTHGPVWVLDNLETVSASSPSQEESQRTTLDEVESHAAASVNRPLYISHFLSTWNVRGFEFGAVLFLATIFPGTLLLMSIYALVRAASAIVLSPMVGGYIDGGNRLQVIRVSIGESSWSWPKCFIDEDIVYYRWCS